MLARIFITSHHFTDMPNKLHVFRLDSNTPGMDGRKIRH